MSGVRGIAALELGAVLRHSRYRGLKTLERLLIDKNPNLIRGDWGSGEAGCILEHLARRHPSHRYAESPGQAFAQELRLTALIDDWDRKRFGRRQLYLAVRQEMTYRRALRAANHASREQLRCSTTR